MRCDDPYADVLEDKVLKLRRLWERLRSIGADSDNELPF